MYVKLNMAANKTDSTFTLAKVKAYLVKKQSRAADLQFFYSVQVPMGTK